jgi:hypothetical protein
LDTQPKGEKQYPLWQRVSARPFTLFAAWLLLTLLAVGLCENGNFQIEGGVRALDLVVWSRLVSCEFFYLQQELSRFT